MPRSASGVDEANRFRVSTCSTNSYVGAPRESGGPGATGTSLGLDSRLRGNDEKKEQPRDQRKPRIFTAVALAALCINARSLPGSTSRTPISI